MDSSLARTIEDLPERFNAASDLLDPNLAAGRGAKTAVIDGAGETSYDALADRVARMAGVFASLGVRREQRVLLCLVDTVDFPTVFLGAIRAGVVPVPLNTLMTPDDYRWMLANSDAAAVFVSSELAHHWAEIAADFPHVRFVSSGGGPWLSLAALIDESDTAEIPPAPTHRDDVAFWLYTSGSTGRPKGAMHTHASMRLTANLFGIGVMGIGEGDVVLSVAKQFFAYGLGNALTFPFAAGATVVLHEGRATGEAITTLICRHKVTVLGGVPTFFAGWFATGTAPTKGAAPALRIATSAGECLPAHLGEAFRARYGGDIIDGLGSTEMLHIFLSQRPGAVKYGCTGKPVPGYETRIVDDAGHPVGPGELGELQVRGPTAAIGYWRNQPKSRATFQGEWMRTGDKYSCDADGWYTYGGRGDDMLKVGGIYVSPIEVEEALVCHAAVLEAAVVGAPDADGLIKPRAYVVVRPGETADETLEAALKAHVKALLAPYKYPRWIEFREELPKTATGKIQRFRLRQTA
ncbi:benzoate-CoA ligase [Sphingomonas vulcanisoli]|uniref:Benzoate-CoA ligase n=1 Tax=Sphingomonas vulcanisoli TaxID=1658060 RepID=A0ABX0U070_9SPHN|nr:benzoate-CoA ligase family protein [Sphingomonas vulcanisoli]NIJ09266.1 benzoate-CoA ligase [Sphingomonas vulcanisoli]